MTEIVPCLFLGNKSNAHDFTFLTNNNITHIVNAAVEVPNRFDNDFKYLNLLLEDNEDQELKIPFDFICEALQNNGRVLIHCQGGVSRSVSVLLAFLMRFKNISLLEAWKLVFERNPNIKPNEGFLRQLYEMDENKFGIRSFNLQRYYEELLENIGFPPEAVKKALQSVNHDHNAALSILVQQNQFD